MLLNQFTKYYNQIPFNVSNNQAFSISSKIIGYFNFVRASLILIKDTAKATSHQNVCLIL